MEGVCVPLYLSSNINNFLFVREHQIRNMDETAKKHLPWMLFTEKNWLGHPKSILPGLAFSVVSFHFVFDCIIVYVHPYFFAPRYFSLFKIKVFSNKLLWVCLFFPVSKSCQTGCSSNFHSSFYFPAPISIYPHQWGQKVFRYRFV